MRIPFLAAALAGGALVVATSAQAQQSAPPPPTPYGMSIDLATAKKLADAALAKAKFPSAVAIVGTGGEIVVLEKQDNSNSSVSELAVKKAQSAAAFRRPTKFFEDALATRPVVGQLGLTAVGGGIPLVKDGHVIGAIGASGAPSSDGDIEAAQGGVDALK
jgi:glc operon protein GlcG